MKRLTFHLLTAALCFQFAATTPAAVLPITALTTTPSATDPTTGDAILASITVDGNEITGFAAPTSVTGNTGSEWLWGTTGTNPGSVPAAVSDLNVTTGSLNTGANTIYGFSQDIDDMSMFFVMANYGGDSPGSVTAVNAAGDAISDPVGIVSGDIGGTLISITVNRSTSGTLNRTVRGFTFLAGDFTYINGNDVDDFAGFTIGSSSYDVQDVGLVATAIPEPASAAMLTAALGLLALRRRPRRS